MAISIDLSEKYILVTGGAGFGVGAGVCKAVAAAGARLIVNDLKLEEAQKAAEQYPGAVAIAGDVSQPEAVERMFRELNERCGLIHGLVNNAGVGLYKPSHEASEADFDRIFNIDVRGLWLMSKAFTHQLLEGQAAGAIVNVASVHARATSPGYAIYSSAKAAVEGLTRGMASDLGKHSIRVNAVAPGYVHSEQGFELIRGWTADPQQWVDDFRLKYQCLPHFIDAEDCGHAAAFLLSELSKSITGTCMTVDAGTTALVVGRDFTER